MLDLSWADALQWLRHYKNELESASYAATLVGVPILLISYITSMLAESRRREVGTYDSLESQYVDFQKLALGHPDLDVADTRLPSPPAPDGAQLAQQRTLYMVLFSLFERAYLLYKPTFLGGMLGRLFMSATRLRQWRGWVSYIDRYLERESCRHAWFNGEAPHEDDGQDFDPRFERFMLRRMRKLGHVA
jgi:hypothetical protein